LKLPNRGNLTSPPPPVSLDRFLQAQEKDGSFARALAELKAGQKTGHWIWWVFPQLKGLGTSENSVLYGLDDDAEAKAYLQHPVLGQRYCDCVHEVYMQFYRHGKMPLVLMGSDVDVMKLRSSLELFLRNGFAGKEIRGRIMMMVQMEKILTEKLNWTHPPRKPRS
jgi:uncharacterized protein (DUF1810 family)